MKKIFFLLFIITIVNVHNISAQCFNCGSIVIAGPNVSTIGRSVTYTVTATNCNYGTPSSKLRWDFGDGTAISSSANHVFNSPGVYIIKCYVNNSSTNCWESYSTIKTIVNGCKDCTGFDFYCSTNLCAKEKISFVKYIAGCSKPPALTGMNFRWDYGDGTGITADSTHTYANPGTYTVVMMTDKCIMAKPITIIDCPTIFSCNPPNFSGGVICRELQSAIGSSAITFDSNPTGKIRYKVTPTNYLSYTANDYNYTWSLVSPPAGVTISGVNNTQFVNIIKPQGTTGDVILKVIICLKTLPACCVTITYNPCRDFNPQIEELAASTHYDGSGDGLPGSKTCTSKLQVIQPIMGGSPGVNYTYAWTGNPTAVITPSNTVGPVTTNIPNKTYQDVNVLVVETSKNGCSKSSNKIFHYTD